MYFDHNATSPLLPEARRAFTDALDGAWGNAFSPHAGGRAAASTLDRARDRVAALVGRDPREVTFTSGATEANALALTGLVTAVRNEIVVSAVEHPSVLAWGTRVVPVDGQGVLDLDALDALLSEIGARTAVVSVMAANNETGVLQPVAAIAARCRAAGVPYHCDASQLAGRLAVDVDADLLTLSSHKMGGAPGAGALVSRKDVRPLLRGGPQERGRRAGTPNVAAAASMGAACDAARASGPLDPAARDALVLGIRALGGHVLGDGAPRLPNTVAALFDVPGDLLVAALDLDGVRASTGSACASGAAEESHVVRAMGLSGIPVRFSLGPAATPTPAEHVQAALVALEEALARARPREVACASS